MSQEEADHNRGQEGPHDEEPQPGQEACPGEEVCPGEKHLGQECLTGEGNNLATSPPILSRRGSPQASAGTSTTSTQSRIRLSDPNLRQTGTAPFPGSPALLRGRPQQQPRLGGGYVRPIQVRLTFTGEPRIWRKSCATTISLALIQYNPDSKCPSVLRQKDVLTNKSYYILSHHFI